MDATTKLIILRQHIELKNESLRAAQRLYSEGDLNESEYKSLVKDVVNEFVNKKQQLLTSNIDSSIPTDEGILLQVTIVVVDTSNYMILKRLV